MESSGSEKDAICHIPLFSLSDRQLSLSNNNNNNNDNGNTRKANRTIRGETISVAYLKSAFRANI